MEHDSQAKNNGWLLAWAPPTRDLSCATLMGSSSQKILDPCRPLAKFAHNT